MNCAPVRAGWAIALLTSLIGVNIVDASDERPAVSTTAKSGGDESPIRTATFTSSPGDQLPKSAKNPVRTVKEASSSRDSMKEAVAGLPLDKIARDKRPLVDRLVKRVSIFRELPTMEFETDPAVYRYFLDHPDVAVSIWRQMGISQFEMYQIGPAAYEADAGDGTQGAVEVLYRDAHETLAVCEGEFKSPLIAKTIESSSLMHLEHVFVVGSDGRTRVRHRVRVFIAFPSQALGAAIKLVSPVSYAIIDRNFLEVSLFVHLMYRSMTQQPGWVEHTATKLEGVLPHSKAELKKLTAHVYASSKRSPTRDSQPATDESAMLPLRKP